MQVQSCNKKFSGVYTLTECSLACTPWQNDDWRAHADIKSTALYRTDYWNYLSPEILYIPYK